MMRQRLLGGSGLRVSQLCLGTLTFGEPKSWGADESTAVATMAAFVEAGGTFLDTAPNYSDGRAEEIVGRFVAGRRDDFVLATKYGAALARHPLAGGNSRKSLVRSIEGSLRRLGTDYVDLLWLHYWDGTAPMDEILRALDDLLSAGKLLHVGLSDTPAWIVSRATTLAELRGWVRPVAIQLEYNVAARDAERELLPMADSLDLGVVCWGPLAAGALAGGASPRRRTIGSLPPALAEIAVAFGRVAAAAAVPPATLALQWLLRRGRLPLIGARDADQARQLFSACTAEFADDVLGQLDGLALPVLGFPHDLIGSAYLRRLALGDPDRFDPPVRARC